MADAPGGAPPPAEPKREKQEGQEDDEVVEVDPEGRYLRFAALVGRGKFKSCHKAFDSQIGIDVAWSKFHADSIHLSDAELEVVVHDMSTNLELEHPNIIKSHKLWEDANTRCINMVTELFTSGNLRQFRNHYPHLDMKAVKRIARQILRGLAYLHSMQPPITHGDLRCDKIYVNGNSGEIKIGDIGLATLMPYRWEGMQGPQPLEAPSDIFAFGLCMLELLTLKQLDLQHCGDLAPVLAEVQDEEARAFVSKCLGDPRPGAEELLDDPFLSTARKVTAPDQLASASTSNLAAGDNMMGASMVSFASTKSLMDVMHAANQESGRSSHMMNSGENDARESDEPPPAPLTVGKLRGEDYMFEFAGKVYGRGAFGVERVAEGAVCMCSCATVVMSRVRARSLHSPIPLDQRLF
jgi:WNK lysine deficient protein kinase